MIDYSVDINLKAWDVILRPWTQQDAELVVDSVIDPHIWKYTTEALSNKEDVLNYVARAVADREASKRYSLAIRLEGSDLIIGSSSFGNISTKDRRIEIGWTWLSKEYHGKGINNIVKYLMMKQSFEELNAHRVEFKTDNANP